jgi:putative heme-binding domain-containing protein
VKSELAKDGAEAWSPEVERIAWLLHPASAVQEFLTRAASAKVSQASRTLAVESLSFVETKEAALAMIKLSVASSPSASEAKGWALMRMTGSWAAFDIRKELKNAGVYDADKVVVTPIEVPLAPAPTYTEQDVLAKTGDAVKGAALAQSCVMCHQLNGNGPAYGPELKGWASRQSREALVRSIVNPSADIALGYEGTTVKLKGSGSIDGRLLSNGDPLVITSTGGLTQLVPKSQVTGRQVKMDRSLMLSSQQLGLGAQDVADIAAYLASYK